LLKRAFFKKVIGFSNFIENIPDTVVGFFLFFIVFVVETFIVINNFLSWNIGFSFFFFPTKAVPLLVFIFVF